MRKTQIIIAAIIMICSIKLKAQDSTQRKMLDEVVVTPTKSPLKQSLTGKVVTVITKNELESSNGRSLGQLLNQQAGLVVNGAFNSPGTNQTIYLRGAALGRTLILIDGIPVNDPSLINNEFDINLLAINDIQRVEICRGAQSTLYGSDAIAGVINIITTRNDITRPVNIFASLAGGTQGTFKSNIQVFGKKDKFNYSFGYSKLTADGFSSAFDSTGKNDFDNDGLNSNIADARIQFQANEHLLLKTFLQYSQYKSDIDASAFKDDNDYSINNKNLITGAGFQYRRDIVTISGNYQYSDIKRNYFDDSISIGGFAKFSKNDYYGKAQFAELYASTKIGSAITLLQGADYRLSGMNNQFLSLSSFGPFKSSFKDTTMSQASGYASVSYNSKNTRLNIELGGRLNVHSRYGTNTTYTFNPAFSFSERFRVFGSIATGFKSPSLYQLYDGSSGNRNLGAEKSTNYEVGVQQQDKLISNRLVFFYRNIKNGIDFNYVSFNYFNFFKQKVQGIEWELMLNPANMLSIKANYTFLAVNETTQNRVLQSKDTSYTYALRRPKHSINITANVSVTSSFLISASLKYIGDRRDVGGYAQPDVLLDDYTLLNAHVSYAFRKRVVIFADLQNITGKKFFDIRGYNSIPFTLMAGATVQL